MKAFKHLFNFSSFFFLVLIQSSNCRNQNDIYSIGNKINSLDDQIRILKSYEAQANMNSNDINTGLDPTDPENCHKIKLAQIDFYRQHIVKLDNASYLIREITDSINDGLSDIPDESSYKVTTKNQLQEVEKDRVNYFKIRKLLLDKYNSLTGDYYNFLIHGKCEIGANILVRETGNSGGVINNNFKLEEEKIEEFRRKLKSLYQEVKELDNNNRDTQNKNFAELESLIEQQKNAVSQDKIKSLKFETEAVMKNRDVEFNFYKIARDDLIKEYASILANYNYMKELKKETNSDPVSSAIVSASQKIDELIPKILKNRYNRADAVQEFFDRTVIAGEDLEKLSKDRDFAQKKLDDLENEYRTTLNFGREISLTLERLLANVRNEKQKDEVKNLQNQIDEILREESVSYMEQKKMIVDKNNSILPQIQNLENKALQKEHDKTDENNKKQILEKYNQRLGTIEQQISELDNSHSKSDDDFLKKIKDLDERLSSVVITPSHRTQLESQKLDILKDRDARFDSYQSLRQHLMSDYNCSLSNSNNMKDISKGSSNPESIENAIDYMEQQINELNFQKLKNIYNRAEAVHQVYNKVVKSGELDENNKPSELKKLLDEKNSIESVLKNLNSDYDSLVDSGKELMVMVETLLASVKDEKQKNFIRELRRKLNEILREDYMSYMDKKKLITDKIESDAARIDYLSDMDDVVVRKERIPESYSNGEDNIPDDLDAIRRRMKELNQIMDTVHKKNTKEFKRLSEEEVAASSDEQRADFRASMNNLYAAEKKEYEEYIKKYSDLEKRYNNLRLRN